MKFPHLDLISNLVKKEIRVRYMGSALGFLWSLGNPLITTLMYLAVFTYIFPNSDQKFPLHLVTGILHWTLLAQLIPQSCDWMVNNANLLRKIWFPRIVLPISGAATVLIFWSSALLIYIALFPFLGGDISSSLLVYPLLLLAYVCFIFGCGLILSVLYVNLRDLKYLIEVILPILFWTSPIIWKANNIPPEILAWLSLNPLNIYFHSFSTILYGSSFPSVMNIFLAISLGIGMLVVGLFVFKKYSQNIVESL